MSDIITQDWTTSMGAQYDSHDVARLNVWYHVVDGLADVAHKQTDRVNALTTELRAARADCATAQRLAQDFRTQVRDLVIKHVRSGDICRDGANEALKALGLDPIESKYEVTVEVTLENVRVTVEVMATDEDAAHDHPDLEGAVEVAVCEALDSVYDRPGIYTFEVEDATPAF